MGSLLAALTAIVVTVLAALLALPNFVDWNTYKPQIEAQIEALVGRNVRILGDVDLRVLPVPRLDMRGLRIADEFGKFEQPFAEVEDFNAVLSIPSLLSGTLEARKVRLDQPIVRLKIDEFNEGTWLSVGPYNTSIPLPVKDLALKRVIIIDGAIELRRAHQHSATRFNNISGEFSSKSLSGPFRFDGTGIIGGGPKTVQLSAAKIPGEPALRVKAALRSTDGVSLYQLDGEIQGLDGPVNYNGRIAARIALDVTAQKAEPGQIEEQMAGKAIEFRADAKVTMDEAELSDLDLTVTQHDRPQSVKGRAFASWADTPRLDLEMESSWLDLDQIMQTSAENEKLLPSEAIAALPRIFEGWAFRPRQGHIAAKVKQAGLGGDIVEDLNFIASHNVEGWQINTLKARLPGETDFNGNGTLPAGEALNFKGNVTFNGQNLSRLLRWAAPSLGVVDTGNAQSFSLSSGVNIGASQLEFTEMGGALGDSTFTGNLLHDFGEASRLSIALSSDHLDLRGLYNTEGAENVALDADELITDGDTPEPGWGANVIPSRKTSLADALTTVFKSDKSDVSLVIAKLQLPDFQARNLRTVFRYDNGTFDIQELNVATTDGLRVDARGRMTDFDTQPDGALNLTIDAPSAQSVTNLARFAGLDSVSHNARSRIEALSPFILRGSLNASANQSILQLSLAGSAGGSELTINGNLRGNFDQLEYAEVQLEGGMGNADSQRLIAQLAPEVPAVKSEASAGDGYLKVSARGTMKSGLTSLITLRTPQARGKFDGQISLLDEPTWSMDGLLDMRASQAATVLSMLRISPGGAPVTGPIDLRALVNKNASNFQVKDLTLKIGGEIITGNVDADLSGKRPKGTIDIEAPSASLPKIAAYLVDWERDDFATKIATVAGGAKSSWPNKAFELDSLTALDGTLKLTAPRLELADGVNLSGGVLNASLDNGKLAVSELSGQIYGGRFESSGSLKRLKGRVGADVSVKLQDIDLAALSHANGGGKVVDGIASMSLSVNSEGLSPSGLVSMFQGSGEINLESGSLEGLSHAALKDAADTYLDEEIPNKEQLVQKLQNDFFEGLFNYEPLSAPVKVRDGILRVSDVRFTDRSAVAEADLIVDLGSLSFDSEWTVASPEKIEGDATLPPVRLVFTGPLATFSTVKADLNADGFERFLTIRRMDQDMERLERLQKERGLRPGQQPGQPPATAAPVSTAPTANSATTTRVETPPLVNAPADQENSVPEQSLLRAPPVVSEDDPTNAVPPVQEDDNTAVSAGWSTGLETTIEETAPVQGGWKQRTQQPPAGSSFEDEIRKVLRSQQNDQPPSYR
ncbi:MAG: AsmA family protein [Hyphomicrobiales bacterium]|nr:AsmA family protein [Hyphomicrobiales bacterium]